MNFVSLVTTDSKIQGRIAETVFEDIKLTQLFSDNVISVMQILPAAEDIYLRHGVFKELEDPRINVLLRELFYKLEDMKVMFEAYGEASEVQEKSYVFCSLLHAICDFCEGAAAIKCTEGLLGRFCRSFADLVSQSDFVEMKKTCDEVYNEYFREFSVLCAENKLVVSTETKQGYVERIRSCAENMEISLRRCDYKPRRLSKELVLTLSALYPELWTKLEKLYESYSGYPDEAILEYADQLDFYLSVYSVTCDYRLRGIPVCLARITDKPKVRIMSAHDITLISKECKEIIPNDVIFNMDDPFFFLSGANGGGKTTYLRTCGVNTILSLLGCPVPAVSSELCMLNTVAAHFPRDERFDTDGRFLDEQRRVDELLSTLGERSLVLLNETYSTTNEKKAAEMTASLANKLYAEKQFGVYVTHQKSVLKEEIPLLCCRVDENDENKRTYKIERINNIGSSHAEDVLKKYSLSPKDLEERFGDLG